MPAVETFRAAVEVACGADLDADDEEDDDDEEEEE